MRSFDKSRSLALFFIVTGTVLAAFAANGCVGDVADPNNPDPQPSSIAQDPIGDNIMKVTVNGSLCGDPAHQYANEPCVSVTICTPGTSNCQTINNILLDTGSYGLRLYQSVITVPLSPVKTSTGDLAECVGFGDNSSEWGQVQYADVQLASEPAVRVPIMTIDYQYAHPPGPCSASQSRPDTGPSKTGFNGILGIGLFKEDCGKVCSALPANGQYYSCDATSCSPSIAKLEDQVKNPITLLPRDNNGSILRLPSVAPNGAVAVEGILLLGIGTQDNNQPKAGVGVYTADPSANFTTTFKEYDANPIVSFIDSGSSVLFFPPPNDATLLPDCDSVAGGSHGASYAGFYCPSSLQTFSASNNSVTGGKSGDVTFQVNNAVELFATGNKVFATMADSSNVGSNAVFDWGLPFFYGRDVYVGIENSNSSLGTGPYWAY